MRDADSGFQGCAYRGYNGTKCAIGLFMTDEDAAVCDAAVYTGVEDIRNEYPEIFDRIGIPDIAFAREMQSVHDGASGNFEVDLNFGFRRLATIFKLDASIIPA